MVDLTSGFGEEDGGGEMEGGRIEKWKEEVERWRTNGRF